MNFAFALGDVVHEVARFPLRENARIGEVVADRYLTDYLIGIRWDGDEQGIIHWIGVGLIEPATVIEQLGRLAGGTAR